MKVQSTKLNTIWMTFQFEKDLIYVHKKFFNKTGYVKQTKK